MSASVRSLLAGEEERLLDLLDGWPFEEGVSGRDFFRRYLENDPTFVPENVVVAEAGGELVSCVQIFPRRMRIAGGGAPGDSVVEVPVGGIGSVFTVPAYRKTGLASTLLARAARSMTERGFVLSGLLAARVRWYESQGWFEVTPYQWRIEAPTEQRTPAPSAAERRSVAVLSGRQILSNPALAQRLRALGERYANARIGTLVRDPEDWQASWRLAGDPEESVYLSYTEGSDRSPETVLAYLRATELYGDQQILEWGGARGAEKALSELFGAVLARHPSLLAAWVRDEPLFTELRRLGVTIERERHASWMFRVLDRSALLAITERQEEGEEVHGVHGGVRVDSRGDRQLIEQVLPSERFEFFMSDRF